MNRPSSEPGKEKVVNIRANTPVVVTMPSRLSRAEGRGAAVVQMPGHTSHATRQGSVVAMPSRSECRTLRSSSVVEMPRLNDTEEGNDPRTLAAWRRGLERLSFADGLRMTLVALFALFGWPRPGHPKDPGAAGARPWKLEILNAISKLHLPAAMPMPARAGAIEFPQALSDEHLLEADLAA